MAQKVSVKVFTEGGGACGGLCGWVFRPVWPWFNKYTPYVSRCQGLCQYSKASMMGNAGSSSKPAQREIILQQWLPLLGYFVTAPVFSRALVALLLNLLPNAMFISWHCIVSCWLMNSCCFWFSTQISPKVPSVVTVSLEIWRGQEINFMACT